MATRTKKAAKGSRTSKIGLAMAALATAGAVSMLTTKTRRKQVAATAAKVGAKVGKAAATATSEVMKKAGPLLSRKPRSRVAALFNR